ncbi:hypothetical protein GCM10010123_02590 [Pilimelia anulata]|uniref:YbaB/EbfC DNA-binding family protein n=1 Tax=Pilimelia anulata TaxID=53371 RepID=A0A8J3B6A6_9ACTN|nr:YbaB/EbfC family nucleoid-associated protein [Pilimelia anulata]GGJ76099.1 hypothetical protein GCM10010123_02590 [Pilimelia anulata]
MVDADPGTGGTVAPATAIDTWRRSLADTAGVGRSPGGHITARTVSGGALRELTVEPAALRLPPAELTAEIVAAVNAAQADYARRAYAIMAPALAAPGAAAGGADDDVADGVTGGTGDGRDEVGDPAATAGGGGGAGGRGAAAGAGRAGAVPAQAAAPALEDGISRIEALAAHLQRLTR